MKPGLKVGLSAEMEITVSSDMLAAFDGQTVHKLYSTSNLVHHMEWVARRILEPYFEEHEEGMGYYAAVSHLMPTICGMKVKLKATVRKIKDKKITCEVEAFNPRGKIARGTIVQAIVEKSWLENKIKEMTLVHQLAREAEAGAR